MLFLRWILVANLFLAEICDGKGVLDYEVVMILN